MNQIPMLFDVSCMFRQVWQMPKLSSTRQKSPDRPLDVQISANPRKQTESSRKHMETHHDKPGKGETCRSLQTSPNLNPVFHLLQTNKLLLLDSYQAAAAIANSCTSSYQLAGLTKASFRTEKKKPSSLRRLQ